VKESRRGGGRARPQRTLVSHEACAVVVEHVIVLFYRMLEGIWQKYTVLEQPTEVDCEDLTLEICMKFIRRQYGVSEYIYFFKERAFSLILSG